MVSGVLEVMNLRFLPSCNLVSSISNRIHLLSVPRLYKLSIPHFHPHGARNYFQVRNNSWSGQVLFLEPDRTARYVETSNSVYLKQQSVL